MNMEEQMDQTTKKQMAEKMMEEKFYTEKEMRELEEHFKQEASFRIEYEKLRQSEKIYRELLHKVLKIKEDEDKHIWTS